MEKYGKIIQYGRANPVWFIENILGCELMDYQKYMVLGGWTAQNAIYVQSRASGKSFIASLIMMSKTILYPGYSAYIITPTQRQSNELFKKIEDIALKNIQSITGNDVFANEIVRSNGNTSGFVISSGDPHVTLYNGSIIKSLNSNSKGTVGIRANGIYYDEAGKIPQDVFDLTEPFTALSTDFKSGVDASVFPLNVPNQHYYFSSAEDTTTHLWHLYKEGAKRMLMGYHDWFVCDVTCEMPLHPTMNGKSVHPLLTKEEIDAALKSNEYKARREYYNLFDIMGGIDNVVSADVIFRNEKPYLPYTQNPNGKSGKKYIIAIDPAHQIDNSFCLITEIWNDSENGWMGRTINGYNMIKTLPSGDKKLYTMPEAVDFIREIMIHYNGDAPEWENIIVFVDPGSGGGGLLIADYLRQDWVDKYGRKHHGIIDLNDEHSYQERYNFPNAIDGVLRLYSPQKFKTAMFDAMREMTSQNLIQFPMPCPRGDILYVEDREIEITSEDKRALIELDLLKEEIKLIRRMVTDKGNVKYGLPPTLDHKVHDDRAYCLAATSYILSVLRKDEQFSGQARQFDYMKVYGLSSKTQHYIEKLKRSKNPFAGAVNPFGRKR